MRPIINRLAVILALVWMIPLALVSVLAAPRYDAQLLADLDSFLNDPACSGVTVPCWQGIRIGETTSDQAIAILNDHPWVSDVSVQERSRRVVWRWSADSPSFLQTGEPARLAFNVETHRIIFIDLLNLNLPLDVLWQLTGEPDSLIWGAAPISPDETSQLRGVVYEGYYAQGRVYVQSTGDCPLDAYTFWDSRILRVFMVDRPLGEGDDDQRALLGVDWTSLYRGNTSCRSL